MICNIVICLIPTVVALVVIRKLREKSWGYCKNNETLTNYVAIVTGANSGIGFEVAKELARRDAEVILACRSIDSGRKAITKIERQFKKALKMRPMELDLASLKSIKAFVLKIREFYPQIHLLINNAGVAYPKNQIHCTADNFEIHFGINHLGHFYLTTLLLDTLKRSAPSRIVVVSSSLHERGKIDLAHIGSVQQTNSDLYANSKLANIYFTRELSKRIKNTGVNVYAACPGWVYTSLFRHSFRWYHYILVAPIAFFFMRSPHQGSQTVIYCATEPDLEQESGVVYRDCKPYLSKIKFDEVTSLKLWEESECLINDHIS